MTVEEIEIGARSGILQHVPGQISVASTTTFGLQRLEIETTRWTRAYLSAEDDPVLAKLWDNDDDAVYDSM